MAKERDYKHEHELKKQRGTKNYGFSLKAHEQAQYEALLELNGCKTTTAFVRKLLSGELVVSERD